MKKITSEMKPILYPNKVADISNVVQDLKKELIYKRDLEEKQKFPKGKFIIAFEPSQKKDFYIMRLKEALNPKKAVAWVDFYDLTRHPDPKNDLQTDDYYEFTLLEEGLVQWENMFAVLNIKVKPGEEVKSIKIFQNSGLLDKIYDIMDPKKVKKRDQKRKSKREESKDEESDIFVPSDNDSDTESVDLLLDKNEEVKGMNAPKGKFKKKFKKTPAMRLAMEEKKRKDAENEERRIHVEVVENGIRITKTRLADDGISIETVEIDPTIKEIRPKKWKFVQREEERDDIDIVDQELMRLSADTNLLYIDNSITTSNRNIIRAAITDNIELAKLCVSETGIITSLMEPWSPEIRSTAIELAISHSSLKVLEYLLSICKEIDSER